MAAGMGTETTAPILVTGGTGTLGRLVVRGLLDARREVRVLSRGKRGRREETGIEFVTADLTTGEGADEALIGTEIIVHCAGSSKGDEVKARHLVRAAADAGVRHLVFISVVGADRIPMAGAIDRAMFGYFGSKRGAELVIADSGIPWTTLRATQFHQLMYVAVRGMARMPILPVPSGIRFQPIEAAEVAARLVELTLGAPAGLVPEIAGPKIYEMGDLVRSYLAATGRHRLLVPMRVPGKAAAALRHGANLSPGRAVGRRTWEEFLDAELRGGAPEEGRLKAA